MWDAQRDDAGDPTNRKVVSADLVDTADGPQLDLAPVMSWLTDPTTKYPVTIDPTITSVTRAGDTWIKEGDTTVHGADYHLGVGYTGFSRMRGLMKFTDAGSRALCRLYLGAAGALRRPIVGQEPNLTFQRHLPRPGQWFPRIWAAGGPLTVRGPSRDQTDALQLSPRTRRRPPA